MLVNLSNCGIAIVLRRPMINLTAELLTILSNLMISVKYVHYTRDAQSI
jgi:hypothetical protein